MFLPSEDVVGSYDGGRRHQSDMWCLFLPFPANAAHAALYKDSTVAYMIYYVITVNRPLFIY